MIEEKTNGFSWRRDLPNFVIIGVPKAGTSSLFHYLSNHPEVYTSPFKETRFFIESEKYEKGLGYYATAFFSGSREYRGRGEATPSYMYYSKRVVPRMRGLVELADTKFIAVLRDPVERAWSAYLHVKGKGVEERPFGVAVREDIEGSSSRKGPIASYYRAGLYSQQLECWLNEWSRDRFLIVKFSNLVNNTESVCRRICRFINVDPREDLPTDIVLNKSGSLKWPMLKNILYGLSPLSKKVLKRVVPLKYRHLLRKKINRFFIEPYSDKPAMDEGISSWLRNQYCPMVLELEDLLGTSFREWR